MAFVLRDRVGEQIATEGTGALVLSGVAISGYQSIGSVMNDGDIGLFCVKDRTDAWNTFLGTYTAATQSLARTVLLDGSNGGGVAASLTGAALVWMTKTASHHGRSVNVEDFGAIGDGDSHPASDHLGVSTLAELQAYGGGIYSFADSIDNEMDYLSIQSALYHGGLVLGRPGAQYLCNKMLINRNGFAHFDGNNSDLLFTGQEEIADDGSNLLTNPSFDDGSTGWENTELEPRVDVVFSGGKATFTDPPVSYGPNETHFGQFGQQVTIPAGRWTVSAMVALSEGASAGARGSRVLGMSLYKDGPGQGGWGWPDPLYGLSAAGIDVGSPYEGEISFDVETPEEVTVWLTFSGFNCDWEVQSARISPFRENYAVWFTGDYTGAGYYFDASVWRNVQIIGPATAWENDYAGAAIDGLLNRSFVEDTRCNFDNVHVRRFRRGVVFGSNTYLNSVTNTTIGECYECLHFLAGSPNAGENFRFSNCIFFNSDLFLNASGGGEWNFFGSSTDYCRRLVYAREGAVMNFHGHHWEFRPAETRLYLQSVASAFTEDATLTGGSSGATATVLDDSHQEDDTPYLVIQVLTGTFTDDEALTDSEGGSGQADGDVVFGDYLFDLDGGAIFTMTSGELLQAGSSHAGALYAARLNTQLDTMAFGAVWGYNWKTATGYWATGAGTISVDRHLGPGNALMPNLMARNFNMDVFGGSGRIAGPSTASDMSFDGPPDGLGFICAVHTDSAPTSRLETAFEGGVYIDATEEPEAGYSSLWVEFNNETAYSGEAAFRLYAPVQPDKVALLEYQWRNPNTYTEPVYGPYTSGVPSAGDTILVTTYADTDLVLIEDKHIETLGGFGPQEGWTVTLAAVSGDPGGIPNAALNTTHTIVERTSAFTYTVRVGTDATSDASGVGGAVIEATYTQTNWLCFFRAFWVNVIGYDDVGRPVIGQEAYQGEDPFHVPTAPSDWATRHFGTWYAEPDTPDVDMDRIARGRAPRWATHIMWIWDYYNIRHVNLGFKADFRLGHFIANVV